MAQLTRSELEVLARHRLEEARLLFNNNYLQGAYYLAGYAIEFSLKALICKRLGLDIFVEFPGKQTQAIQTHDLSTLLIYAGLHTEHKAKIAEASFFAAWSKVAAWSEQRRYETLTARSNIINEFLNAINTILTWLEQHY